MGFRLRFSLKPIQCISCLSPINLMVKTHGFPVKIFPWKPIHWWWWCVVWYVVWYVCVCVVADFCCDGWWMDLIWLWYGGWIDCWALNVGHKPLLQHVGSELASRVSKCITGLPERGWVKTILMPYSHVWWNMTKFNINAPYIKVPDHVVPQKVIS